MTKFHIQIFDKFFEQNYFKKNLLLEITLLCISETKKGNKFYNWFSEDNPCFEHRTQLLKLLLLLLLKKNALWLKDKLLKSEKVAKGKKNQFKEHKVAKKIRIIKE